MSQNLASVDYGGAITDGFRNVATFVPSLLGCLLILLVGYLVARLVAKLVDRGLRRAHFDRMVERGSLSGAMARTRMEPSGLVARVVFFAIMIPVLSAAIGVLGIAALSVPLALFIALIPKILVALVLVVLGAALAGFVKNLVSGTLGTLSYGNGLATAAGALVMVLFAKAALDEVGIAQTVTDAVLFTALAIVAGVTIVGVGGGLIRPMQQRWDGILDKASAEARNVKETAARSQTASPMADYTSSGVYPADPYATPTASMPTTAPAGAPVDPRQYRRPQ